MTTIIKITNPTNTPNLATPNLVTGDVRVSWQIKKCGHHRFWWDAILHCDSDTPWGSRESQPEHSIWTCVRFWAEGCNSALLKMHSVWTTHWVSNSFSLTADQYMTPTRFDCRRLPRLRRLLGWWPPGCPCFGAILHSHQMHETYSKVQFYRAISFI